MFDDGVLVQVVHSSENDEKQLQAHVSGRVEQLAEKNVIAVLDQRLHRLFEIVVGQYRLKKAIRLLHHGVKQHTKRPKAVCSLFRVSWWAEVN